MSVTFVAAQTIPTAGDVERNTAQHVALIEACARFPSPIVVFPELSLTGYELRLASELAFEEQDARLSPLILRTRPPKATRGAAGR